ncbi:3',5'-cyclic-AMP phosphodiesterase [Leptolyngbya sp. AN02str]|uniref:3',5'-cyclic-AMP phosphodiesterase n=1 Tax=Leptolyngbya sp. AN02str TaxID=3423363 RepID=UPI003D30FC66
MPGCCWIVGKRDRPSLPRSHSDIILDRVLAVDMGSALVAQLTDTHLFAESDRQMKGVTTAHTFEAVVRQVAQLVPQPDLLLLTGDLTQDETVESYQRLQSALVPLGIPTHWIPGNHDIPELMASTLVQAPFSAAKQVEMAGWSIVMLNSAVPGQTAGRLSAVALGELEHRLSAVSDRPTLVVLHHPPLRIESEWMDEIGLENSDEFLAVIDRHAHVKLVVFGHIHQAFSTERNGVRYVGTPSTCVQFKPKSRDLEIDEKLPGFRLISLGDDGQFETQVHRVVSLR